MKNSRYFRLFVAALAVGAPLFASCTPKGADNSAPTVTAAPPKIIDTILVPGDDDKLHPKKVSFNALDTQLKSGGKLTPALEEIIKTAPEYFPKGTVVQDVKDGGEVFTVLLSPEFADSKHWQKGEKTTELAVYSIVNTLAQDGKKVALTIEGKPLLTVGELDVSGNIEANTKLNAKK